MCYFNGNLAKELARETGWEDKIWSRRYQSIVVSAEEEVQVARLRYSLSHGVKENLVARAEEWPGVHCVTPLLTGAPVEGTWFDRILEYTTRLRRKELAPGESASPETVHLSPLPAGSISRRRLGGPGSPSSSRRSRRPPPRRGRSRRSRPWE